jgi:hypothetical protein
VWWMLSLSQITTVAGVSGKAATSCRTVAG